MVKVMVRDMVSAWSFRYFSHFHATKEIICVFVISEDLQTYLTEHLPL